MARKAADFNWTLARFNASLNGMMSIKAKTRDHGVEDIQTHSFHKIHFENEKQRTMDAIYSVINGSFF